MPPQQAQSLLNLINFMGVFCFHDPQNNDSLILKQPEMPPLQWFNAKLG